MHATEKQDGVTHILWRQSEKSRPITKKDYAKLGTTEQAVADLLAGA